jgi:tetratricopeptide (TPR) repeat protein
MVDSLQHWQPDEHFDFNQIFIGREQQLAEFERILREWKHALPQNLLEDTPLPDMPSPQNRLPGLVVLLYGRGGFGKSTLLRHFHEIATRQNDQSFSGKVVVWACIDWETGLDERRRSFSNPAQGQSIDPSEYYRMLCSQFASRSGKSTKDFHTYQQAAEDVAKAKKEASKVLDAIKHEGEDRYKDLRGASVEAVATVLSTSIPGSKLVVENAAVKKGAEHLLQLTGEQIGHLYQHFRHRLGEKLSDYLEPARKLGLALGKDLNTLAKNFPVLIFFDTYEEIDEGDALLRIVMGAASPRVGWVIAGRDNLWSGPGQMERSTVLEYGYKEIVAIDRSLSVNFNSEDVGAFTLSNIKEYFDQVCEHFPCRPPLAKLGDDAIKRIWDVTTGIPLAINIAAALYSETGDLDKVTGKVAGKKKIIDGMVRRYLLHTRVDERERSKLYALAMLRHPVQRSVLAVAIGLTAEEAREPNRYNKALSHLHRRYSFIFTEEDEPILHQEVRLYLRLWLLERREQPDILAINEHLIEAHAVALQKLETQRNYSTLKERLQDDQWTEGYLNLVEQQFWLDPVEGLRYLLPFMIVAAIYQRDLNKTAAEIGTFFAAHLPGRYHDWWEWVTASLVYRHNRNRSLEERSGLELINKLLGQGQFKAPSPLNQYEELAAALWWRVGEAYQYDDNHAALQWYEKALVSLKQEEGLKEAFAEVCCTIAKQLGEEKKYIESMHYANRAIEVKPGYPWAYLIRGIAYRNQQQYDLAIEDYTTAIGLDPKDAAAYNNRGRVYDEQQEYDLAIDNYTTAIGLDPKDAVVCYNRGIAYQNQQEYDLAIEDYTTAIGLDPKYAAAYNNRGLAHQNQQEYDLAIEDYTTAIGLDPKYVATYNNRGLAYQNQQEYDLAMEDYTTAIGLDPKYAAAYYNRGIAYSNRQQYELAIENYTTAIGLDPKNAAVYHNRGWTYSTQQEYDLAMEDYTTAIGLDPKNAAVYHNRGWTYSTQQQYDLAMEDYTTAIGLDPKNAAVYHNRGYVYLRLKNVKQATSDFIEGSKIDPGNVNAAWMVVFASMEKQPPGVEVAKRLETIAALDPQSHQAYICLAVALGLCGKLKDGLEKLELALQEQSDSDDALFWKGMLSAYYYQGRRPQITMEAIEKALTCKLPPVLLKPLYWLEKDVPDFFREYAKPLLERYEIE